MTTACEEDLGDGRKPWAMRHRSRERAMAGSPHQEVGSQEDCVSLPIRHRSQRGGPASQSINHTAPKNLANLWPVCHTGCTHNKAVCPPNSAVWGCNLRRSKIMELSVEGSRIMF